MARLDRKQYSKFKTFREGKTHIFHPEWDDLALGNAAHLITGDRWGVTNSA